ncbi:MAG: bifunctional glutamate N-acetyltransferase/amino-acid acetyltransferase ArgJ [Oscillospiraceae bacterium]|nr:bifunctional glutamate N-acetyltransferase/amino-acid acetyltransferase ArgJ [Oscillospiraceae bacterium]
MKIISGGVTAAKGFAAAGVHCGIRKNHSKKDLALIVSSCEASAAGVYTTNLVKGAPVQVTRKHICEGGKLRAVICNSGNANTCTSDGIEKAEMMCRLVSDRLGVSSDEIAVASTGVIGQTLPIEPIENAMDVLFAEMDEEGSENAALAIMTTDTVKKEIAVEFTLGGKVCRMGGIAKGSGMIHPNMATMLVFITTDAAVPAATLQKILSADIRNTFNMVSVDGDTSTSDMVIVMANGLAENGELSAEDEAELTAALRAVTGYLCKMIAADGEGATKLLECRITGAFTEADARIAAKSVIGSSLLKAAMFGADANWGRVLCAVGYSGANVDVDKVDVSFESAAGTIEVCREGRGVDFSEELAKKILSEKEIAIVIGLNSGEGSATAWGCDLTYDYVRINGDYRT